MEFSGTLAAGFTARRRHLSGEGREKESDLVLDAQADWTLLEWFEFMSYLVTVVGLPFAILVFIHDKRRERQNDEEEIFQRLSDQYTDFLKLVLANADLQLLRHDSSDLELTAEQLERKSALFSILISIFERAYMLVYEEDMGRQTQRLWQSWEDYMREWCSRSDFREALPRLLQGEDEDFARRILRIAEEEAATSGK
jgi:hypothetical protein